MKPNYWKQARRLYRAFRKHILLVIAAYSVGIIAYTSARLIPLDGIDFYQALSLNLSVSLVALLLLTAAAINELHINRRDRRSQNRPDDSLEFVTKNLQHVLESRTGVNEYFSQMFLTGSSKIDLEQATENYIADLLHRTKLIFDFITEDDCSVCIKLFELSSDGKFPEVPVLKTTIRDASSSAERMIDRHEVVPITDNTAFYFIAGQKRHKYYYYNNDLYRSYLSGDYVNSRESWFKFYNATAVCAIKNPSKGSDNDTLGFLCVDNFKGRFDSEVSCAIMKCLSTCLFYVYKNLSLIQAMENSPDRDGVTGENRC